MFIRRFFSAILLVGMLISQLAFEKLAVTPCSWAQFVADLSIPDGSYVTGGTMFTKTWRLKNIGTCTWSTAYKLVFVSGEQMSAMASFNLPVDIPPGQLLDISANMLAPLRSGHYRGFWKLSTDTGALFGIGSSASNAFWVDINVVENSVTVVDFVANAPYAQWKSGAGPLPFPGGSNDTRGYAYRVDNPLLENGAVDTGPALITVPHNKYNGYIQAVYPDFLVQQGDRFQTLVNCEYGAAGCYVSFRLDYMNSAGSVRTLWTGREYYNSQYTRADMDLSALAGQSVKFILTLLSAGSPNGDRAVWSSPRIVRLGGVPPSPLPPTLTPLPPFTPTVTPFGIPPTIAPTACDKATLVADLTVANGTVFSPNTGFTKTWRLKNSGTCAWNTSYRLILHSGDQMGAPTLVPISMVVAPGQTIDLSVNMVAPALAGKYRSNWILQNGSGNLFGIGANSTTPIWVEINVVGDASTDLGYDFASNVCAAQWKSEAGIMSCPGLDGDLTGFVVKLDSPIMEDGTIGIPGLLVAPQYKYNGIVQGVYPAITVQPGDRFQSSIGCQYGSICYVTFRIDYKTSNGSTGTFWSWRERSDGRVSKVDVDLSQFVGRSVQFILTVYSAGSPAGDRAIWGSPRIVHVNSRPAPLTPTPTLTPTVTVTVPPTVPPPGTDWLTYNNSKYGFQFKYPPQSVIVSQDDNNLRINLPIPAGTDLGEKFLDMRVFDNVTTCAHPLAIAQAPTSETVVINGTTFTKRKGMEPAAGNIYKWTEYTTVRNNVCFAMLFVLHSVNPGNLYPAVIPLYDEAIESVVFSTMMSTFTWLTLPPPPTDWFTFTNTRFGFQFKYPGQSVIGSQDDWNMHLSLPIMPGTNLREKYLEMRVVENISPCYHPLAGLEITKETVVINGITFTKRTGMDGAAGSTYNWVEYSTTRNNVCVAMLFILHSVSPGVYLPTVVPEYDMTAESAIFANIMSTFLWLTTPARSGPYTVVNIPTGGTLNIYSAAGVSNPVIDAFQYNATDITRTGVSAIADGSTWFEVWRPLGGNGWVNSFYLTEYVSSQSFCSDARIMPMIESIKQSAIESNSGLFASMISPLHGVNVNLWRYSDPVNFTPFSAKDIYSSSTAYVWGGGPSGGLGIGTFKDVIQPKVVEGLNASNREVYCDNLTKVFPLFNPWPYNGVHYYNIYKPSTVSTALDFRTWLIGFEYIDDQPYLYGMITIVWEP